MAKINVTSCYTRRVDLTRRIYRQWQERTIYSFLSRECINPLGCIAPPFINGVARRIRRPGERGEEERLKYRESHLNNWKRQYPHRWLCLPIQCFVGINIGDWIPDHMDSCYTEITVKTRNTRDAMYKTTRMKMLDRRRRLTRWYGKFIFSSSVSSLLIWSFSLSLSLFVILLQLETFFFLFYS